METQITHKIHKEQCKESIHQWRSSDQIYSSIEGTIRKLTSDEKQYVMDWRGKK